MLIRYLKIEHFRGIDALEWLPDAGINCLLGPGDARKTTVLNAVAMLLDPRPPGQASEFDYYLRRLETGFSITAVIAGIEEALAGQRVPPLRGWKDGKLQPLPEDGAEAVIVARVTGTPELEINHTLETADGGTVMFSSLLRQQLLLARVATGDRASSELRLARGSLLERAVGGPGLRAALATAVAQASASITPPPETIEKLAALGSLFAEVGLPGAVDLGIVSAPGTSALGMLGLVTGEDKAEAIPLALAGLGTRQLALFRIAASQMGTTPIIVADEPEIGLEPYRQRMVVREVRRLCADGGQAFITTHSPSVIAATEEGELWRFTISAPPVKLKGIGADKLRTRAPDALLAQLPVLCEGATEYGVLRPVLDYFAARDGFVSLDALGIRPVEFQGHEETLASASNLLDLGIRCGVFVDREDKHSGRRAALAARSDCALGVWTTVRAIEDAVAQMLPWQALPAIVALAASQLGTGAVDLLQQVGHHAQHPGRLTLDELAEELGDQQRVRDALGLAMSKGSWFKNAGRGQALGSHLIAGGMPAPMDKVFADFWERARALLP